MSKKSVKSVATFSGQKWALVTLYLTKKNFDEKNCEKFEISGQMAGLCPLFFSKVASKKRRKYVLFRGSWPLSHFFYI